ncbi:MAG: RagB/SusD family nutrient uptake outer membrane protein [Tannerella sp.]|jgi:hypothetical protein|nr:RagB/SusD family nutrient uptake outer membrane protein [Tannerella sp.]
MKRYLVNIAIAMIAATACTDLEEKVYDKLPYDQFGSTLEEMYSIIGPAYKTLKYTASYDQLWGWDNLTSDMLIAPTRIGGDWWDGGVYMEQTNHHWNVDNWVIPGLWNPCMSGITTVNSIISLVEPNELMEPDQKLQVLGELRGLRAYWYYVLCDWFGNVPIVTDFNDTSLPTNRTRKEVFDFVVSELNDIIPYLREDVTSQSYGKFTKGAALTLLAKMYLNAEVWTGVANWQGVIDACDGVMELDYIIEPDWSTNFAVHNEVSREAILPACFSDQDDWGDMYNAIHYYTLHYLDPIALGFSGDTWNGVSAQTAFVNSFSDDDRRKEATFLTGPMIDPATGEVLQTGTAGHPLIHGIEYHIVPGTEGGPGKAYPEGWGEVFQEDGARIQKWEFQKGMQNSFMENDIHIFRLADVYLMKAEALVRQGSNMGEALRLVNIIRERGFGNSDHNLTALTLEDIYNERRFELAFEFGGRQDMIRFGTFTQPNEWKPWVTEEYRKILPIPLDAWRKNNNLVQNPGYPAF